tara:strand:- start:70 stop:462 length:393 start_codon:yes stop_codon:yes gene_type:complete
MVFKINKLFLKIASLYKFIVLNILFIAILILFSIPVFSYDTNTERNLAYKYCKSIESNMFRGLDDERILKYEYFFNSVNKVNKNEIEEILNNFISEVENICSYKLKSEEKEDFRKDLNKYISNNQKKNID